MGSSNRRLFLETGQALDQSYLDQQHDALYNKLEMIVDIETPSDTIHASDRNKWTVDGGGNGVFYEALLNFPTIKRTVGEFLDPTLTFSDIKLDISNVDGRFNDILPGGANFGGWIDKQVTVKLGLAEDLTTYTTIFKGRVTDVGGFARNTDTITIIARDDNDRTNRVFPTTVFDIASYPKIGNDDIGKGVPVIYGDWTTNLNPFPAVVPTTIVNKADPFLDFENERPVIIEDNSSPNAALIELTDHRFDLNDEVELTTNGTLPTPFATGTKYFVVNIFDNDFELSTSASGPGVVTTSAGSGTHSIKPWQAGNARADVEVVIAINDLTSLDTEEVYLRRGDLFTKVPSSEITVGSGNKSFTIPQDTANLWVDGESYKYASGDEFFVRVVGKDLSGGTYTSNVVEQARDLLLTYGGLTAGDFDSNWDTFRDKTSPPQSAIQSIKSRIWVQEQQEVMTYALSLLEQVRLEAFIERVNLKFKLLSMHFDDFVDSPSHDIRNWDIVEKSFKPSIDDRNNALFNRGQGIFNFFPILGEQARSTIIFRNNAAITQHGKEITRSIVYPNLYIAEHVENQYKETLKFASSTVEIIDTGLTWRSMLLDIGDFVKLNIDIGSTILVDVPAFFRSIGYDPRGLKIVAKLFSLQMVPFGSYNPGYTGIVGGENATITAE